MLLGRPSDRDIIVTYGGEKIQKQKLKCYVLSTVNIMNQLNKLGHGGKTIASERRKFHEPSEDELWK
jgi:hypothetical protein